MEKSQKLQRSRPRRPLDISAPKQLRALASPLRQAMVDALESLGSCSVAELADLLGRPPDRLYYHLRLLERVRLVSSTNASGQRGRLETRFELAGRPTRLRYAPHDHTNAALVGKIVGSTLRDAHRAFRRAYAPGAIVTGRRRNLWAGRRLAWLDSHDLEKVNALLERLVELLQTPRDRTGARLYAFTFTLSPYGGDGKKGGRRSPRRR